MTNLKLQDQSLNPVAKEAVDHVDKMPWRLEQAPSPSYSQRCICI